MKFLLLLLTFSPISFSASMPLTEAELPALIEKGNGQVRGAEALVESRKAQLGYLKRSFLPRFELSVGQERTDASPASDLTHSYGYYSAEAKVNLFNGGRDKLREDMRKASLTSSQAELLENKFGALTLARTLFWRIIYQKEVIATLESALELNEKNLQSALKKIRNNLATRTDEIDFDQTKSQLSQDLLKAKILLSNNMRELAALLNHPLDTTYEVPATIVHEPGHALDEFEQDFKAQEHRDILSLTASELATHKERLINSRWWTPQLDLYGLKSRRFEDLAETTDIDREVGTVLGVKLTFFFDGLESRADSVSDAYRALSVKHLRKQRALELESSYQNAYQLYELNHDLVHTAEKNNKLAQRYYDNVWNEYLRGVKNSPDVLQAFMRVVEAKLRYAEIKKDYQVARAQIQGLRQE